VANMPHARSEIQPSNVKATATYDISSYGEDLFLPFTDVGLTETALVFSTAVITRDLENSNQPMDDFPAVYSAVDAGLLLNEGNNTQFSQTYSFVPDMTAIIYAIHLVFPAVVTCSAFTSGTLNVGALHIKITERSTNNRLLYENTFQSNAANLTGTGTSLHFFQRDIVETIKIEKGNPIDILVELITVKTGTNTRQEGLCNLAPYLKTAVLKRFTPAGMALHLHADLSHADGVFKYKKDRVSMLGQ
tara:strand:+ start:1180 stop:1920 length:741 start_codon:yes stop_codon:yes gene_type:complete